jgi:hypothetical protein
MVAAGPAAASQPSLAAATFQHCSSSFARDRLAVVKSSSQSI